MTTCPVAAMSNDGKPVSPVVGDRPFALADERRFLLRRLTVRRRRGRPGPDRRTSERRRPMDRLALSAGWAALAVPVPAHLV
jgi:hypothetical protein